MQSNRDRIKEMIEHISTFNDADPGEGISRFSYSCLLYTSDAADD